MTDQHPIPQPSQLPWSATHGVGHALIADNHGAVVCTVHGAVGVSPASVADMIVATVNGAQRIVAHLEELGVAVRALAATHPDADPDYDAIEARALAAIEAVGCPPEPPPQTDEEWRAARRSNLADMARELRTDPEAWETVNRVLKEEDLDWLFCNGEGKPDDKMGVRSCELLRHQVGEARFIEAIPEWSAERGAAGVRVSVACVTPDGGIAWSDSQWVGIDHPTVEYYAMSLATLIDALKVRP